MLYLKCHSTIILIVKKQDSKQNNSFIDDRTENSDLKCSIQKLDIIQ
jgi:hypothetical protein